MKRLIVLFLMFMAFVSCNDGNFEVPSFVFDTTINGCGEYVLYRTNMSKTEALILTLTKEQLPDTMTTTAKIIPISGTNLQYRIFSDKIGSDYFCQAIPPVSPQVAKQWVAVSGTDNTIEIITSFNVNEAKDTLGYTHEIGFKNMVLKHDDETIIYDTYDFGTYKTPKP